MESERSRSIDLSLIMKIVALICCVVAVCLTVWSTTNSYSSRSSHVSNSLIYSTGSYIVILGFCFLWTLIRDPVDGKFFSSLLMNGGIWTILAGIGVIWYIADYKYTTHVFQLVGGIFALFAGVAMIADSVYNYASV